MTTGYVVSHTMSMTNHHMVTITGVTYFKDKTAKVMLRDIQDSTRTCDVEKITKTLKSYGVLTLLDDIPYEMLNMSDVREQAFKDHLTHLLKDNGGKWEKSSSCIMPVKFHP